MDEIPSSGDLENAFLSNVESSTKLTGTGLLSRFQRKMSMQPRNCDFCIRGRKTKKSKLHESTADETYTLNSIDEKMSCSGSGYLTSDTENERERKTCKAVNQDILENRRIDRFFQVMRKGRSLDLQEVANVRKFRDMQNLSDKENAEYKGTSKPRYLERVRKLMERHNINEEIGYRSMENEITLNNCRNIPEATRSAFNMYTGSFRNDSIPNNFNFQISPLFEYNDGDRGEFYLFYKRILHHLLTRDAKSVLKYEPTFLSRSKLSANVRATLFDWMIKVQQYLRIQTETLHLAASYVDQYTWRYKLVDKDYQLLGITALLLAAKVNQRVSLSLQTLCYLTENSFIPKQIIEQEKTMLTVLNFDVNLPIAHHFLGLAMLSCDDLNSETRDKVKLLCLYLFDLGLTEFDLAKYPASMKCAASLYLARQFFINHNQSKCQCNIKEKKEQSSGESYTASPEAEVPPNEECCSLSTSNIWNNNLASFTGYHECQELLRLVRVYSLALCRIQKVFFIPEHQAQLPASNISQAAFIKFSNKKYARIARIPELTNICCLKNFNGLDADFQS